VVLHYQVRNWTVIGSEIVSKLVDQFNEDQAGETQSGQLLGTPGYMAPEQVRGELETIGFATDVYGLGAVLYECLTGRGPFQGRSASVLYQIMEQSPPPPRQIRPEVPISLERICLKCLQKNPRKRYAGADQLARALEQFLAGEGPEEASENESPRAEEKREEGQLALPASVEWPRQNTRRALLDWVLRWFVFKRT
jgi:serine/threonine protein kinase